MMKFTWIDTESGEKRRKSFLVLLVKTIGKRFSSADLCRKILHLSFFTLQRMKMTTTIVESLLMKNYEPIKVDVKAYG
jgi:hypothetical protein